MTLDTYHEPVVPHQTCIELMSGAKSPCIAGGGLIILAVCYL